MIFNIQHSANWEYIKKRKQHLIDKNNERENAKRIPHEYKVGDKVLLTKGTENKYEQPRSGPHPIIQIFQNGTVEIQKGAVSEVVNIRRITPYVTAKSFDQGGRCNMCRSKRLRSI